MLYPFAQWIDQLLAAQEKGQDPQGWHHFTPNSFPQVNLYEEEDHLVLTAELAGYQKADLSLEVKEDQFTFRAKPVEPKDKAEEAKKYHFRERAKTVFERRVKLPYRIDAAKVEAHFEDGLLSVTLPRIEADKAQNIILV
ncbi:MAG: hypothetical protein A2508_06440 [Candidatus Lambdaproteobacteria bacterium RIFOXYD12_FULL_49_8]|uniref:SHSP domain-containing protein n=1 Tax=Candidatus Lambdaproteobacteria bacterium RIFOXYD2_FULL_50_16 TaxID=1817772 RepID=A0A1F6G9V7_9PROT|nr:MAG: hypothetical protein A2527_05120 [Candidatus Lambdaproteobacteria bacterium RIFOXYD2_FULL_50_16]OGG97452.1 MAG: hypothetical protein A2508_06440 [Candidatus Lambdaproteobacteria bacterium RIFOXYD12_FULL_49_8]